jgi:hypothetical protein
LESELKVIADAYEICPGCIGHDFTPEEHQRKCFGRVQILGEVACGKKAEPTSGKELYPVLWKPIDE